MRLGWVGLGKLGGPIAGLLAETWDVQGHDPDPDAANTAQRAGVHCRVSVRAVAASQPDLLFVAVPTPHGPEHDGTRPVPETRADFDYTILAQVLNEVDHAAAMDRRTQEVVVVSTCLPGTWRSRFAHLAHLRYVHAPSFVGMGSVVRDFVFPEFWLIGTPDRAGSTMLEGLIGRYDRGAKIVQTDVTTAEAIKVAYNTAISVKIALANAWGELSDRLGIDVDEVTDALALAKRRIVSPAYLRAGMGDGGPCHPRDLIALSWLAQHLELSYDLFGAIADARDAHTQWLADLVDEAGIRPVLFGGPFKPGVDLLDGSPALLLEHYLIESGAAPSRATDPDPGHLNVIVTAEPRYAEITWPAGCTVIDPFGIIPDQDDVTILRPGRRPRDH